MKDYTVYLVFEPNGDWHEGHVVHVSCETTEENAILAVACDKLEETQPDVLEWCIRAYLILEGNIEPKFFFNH